MRGSATSGDSAPSALSTSYSAVSSEFAGITLRRRGASSANGSSSSNRSGRDGPSSAGGGAGTGTGSGGGLNAVSSMCSDGSSQSMSSSVSPMGCSSSG